MIEYYNKVKENRTRFDEMVERTVCETDDEEAIKLATDAARFASLCGVGLLASSALERKLCSIAESICDDPAQGRTVGGTCLVATELYPVGGHTKVLERVAVMLKNESRLSLVLTASTNRFVPDAIRDAVESSGGEVVILEDGSRVRKSLRLRELAEGYDRVLLMVHPEDAVSVVAFGTSRFKKPVFYYNHANHTFWLGVSVADRILDVNKWGVELCCRQRGVKRENIESVGIPLSDSQVSAVDGSAVRRELGIGASETLVTAAGSPRKFRNFDRWRFGDFIEQILSENSAANFLIIGAERKAYPEWDRIMKRFGCRLKLKPQMPYNRLLEHFAASDVVVDSFPMSGWTSMMDAVRQKAATVYPAGVTGPMDYFADSSAFAPDAAVAVSIVRRLLLDGESRKANIEEMFERVRTAMNPDAFKNRLRASFGTVDRHSLHDFHETAEPEDSPLSAFIYSMTVRSKIKFSFLGVQVCSVRSGLDKKYRITFAGWPKVFCLPWRVKRVFGFPGYLWRRARIHTIHFDHIHSLGMNCEVAYRFFKSNGFVESSLFSWTYAPDMKTLTNVLPDAKRMFSGPCIRPNETGGLHKCGLTGMSFHGKEHQKVWFNFPFDEVRYQNDLEELRCRVDHLYDVFLSQLRDESSVLLIYKVSSSDPAFKNVDLAIKELWKVLSALGAHNVRLLIVCERQMLKFFPAEHPDYLVRCVEEFNPEANVATTKLGDYYGWRLLFDEFKSRYVPLKRKTYKFERQ